MKYVLDNDLMGIFCKVYHGQRWVTMPGGTKIVCKDYDDARLMADLINRLALEIEDKDNE